MRKLTVLGIVLVSANLGLAKWLGTGQEQAPQIRILSNSNLGAVVDIALPGICVEPIEGEGVIYDLITIPGQTLAGLDVGKPQVPKISLLLGIPENSDVNARLEVLESRYFENINCYPYQTPATDRDNFPFVIDRQFYGQNTDYPEFDVRVSGTGVWRELAVGGIQVYPVHYNPGTKRLTLYTKMRVRVSYSGGSYRRKTIQPWLASVYRRWIDNFDELDLSVCELDTPGIEYLVIAHSKWASHPLLLDSLLGWHEKRGIRTRLLQKSDWTATEIKDSIRAEYNRHSPATLRWVLLVGEYGEIPMYSMGGVGRSDYWYSDLLPASPDNYPEIGLGRFSPLDSTDLANQIRKTLAYAKSPPGTDNWLRKHSLIACSQDYPGKYSGCIRGIYNEPMAWWRYDFDTLMCKYYGNDAIAEVFNSGRSVVTYRGHGDIDQWYTMSEQGAWPWYIADVNNLTNGALTPVVYNIACLCGDIYQPTCLAEAWMRKYPGGAVANMAATQASYTYPNHGICSTIVRSMCDTWTITVPGVRDYVLPVLDIGWIQCNVDAYVAKYWPDGQYPDNIYMYLNLGDPALEVWSGGQPQTPSVDYPTVVPLGPKDFRVTVTVQGNPVLGALVCVAKDTEFYSTGYTDADGRVTLQTNALTPGSFSLTVSSGHAVGAEPTPILPFEGTGMTVSGCYVVYLRHEIADPAPGGNGDGIVNPGETVKVVVWVKNRGIRPSNDVIAKLHSEDPAVVVLDSVRSLGTIAAGDSASTGSDGFLVSVSDTCSNGHFVSLGLICRDAADSSWASYFGLSVGTGVLEYAGKRVSDPAPGGNDNGRLDANETAELFLRLRNVGLGHAYDVRGLLRSGDVRFQVHDSTVNWPFIKKDSLAENTGGGFKVSVGNVAPETDISCTLYVASDDGYHATLPLRLVIGELRPVDPIHDNGVPTLYWAVDESDSGYSERPDFNWIECRGKGFRLGLADDQTMAVSLPPAFGPFIYYNQRYTRISVCSNGWIAAGLATSVSGINAELPTNRLPVPVVCANWDDLDPSAGGSIWVFHDSTNHAYVVEWDSVPYRDAACGTDKFEIVIFDTTLASGDGNSEILVQYQTANGYSSNTVGIQDHTRTVGITCLFDGEYHRGTGVIQAGSAIKYTTDAPLYPLSEPGIISKTPAPILKVSSPVARYVSAEFTLASPTAARLVVYDPSGRELDVLFDTRGVLTPPGSYSVRWNGEACGRKVPSGIYFLQLETRDGTIARKVVKLE